MVKLARKQRHLNNLIDKKFKTMLSPLDLTMSFMLFNKYNNCDDFVIPISRVQMFKSLVVIIGFIVLVCFRFKPSVALTTTEKPVKIAVVTANFDLIYYFLLFISFFIAHVKDIVYYPDLIINLQKASRTLPNGSFLKRMFVWNLVSIIAIPMYYMMLFVLSPRTFGDAIKIFPLIFFDMNIVYVIQMMWVIEQESKLYLNYLRRCNNFQNRNRINETKLSYQTGKKMFATYRYILNAFESFKIVCRMPITFHLIETVAHWLLYMQIIINSYQQATDKSLYSLWNIQILSLISWVSKNCLLLILFCVACENFYLNVRSTVVVCNEILMHHITEDTRRLCKNVRRAVAARDMRVRVFGGAAGARLLPLVFSVFVSYFVVVLQFDFL